MSNEHAGLEEPTDRHDSQHGHTDDLQPPPPINLNLGQHSSQSGPSSAPPESSPRLPDRPNVPTRSSTVGADGDHNLLAYDLPPHSHSEDLNHTSSSTEAAALVAAGTPGSAPKRSSPFSSSEDQNHSLAPTNFHQRERRPSSPRQSEESLKYTSAASHSSDHSASSSYSNAKPPPTVVSTTSTSLSATACAACNKPLQGPLVRALGTVFHLSCFKCLDCGDVVATKFFPIDGPDGRQQPLCERDYFRRLNLICAKCGMALRGSYITACNKKFHVEHFTCSLCTTLFGPQDSYYEHDSDVYCHFHYSTRFATKCAGCNSAILKQFVEINRNMRDECWHPECYMINKFWNVKVVARRPTSSASIEGEPEQPLHVEEEQQETATSLKDKQQRMEQLVYRIWTVLSAFEESSAACISDMLGQVSNGQYLDAIRMAEKFILHVEVLFATIDDLEHHFSRLNLKGMSHVREARMLCRKTVELFGLLSNTQETGTRRMGMTQELLALVTGLAHYLKILIRIALTGALKLEREQSVREAMNGFLDKLHLLAVQGGNPTARRLIKGPHGEYVTPTSGSNYGTQGVTYGFRSLAPENAGESPFAVTSSAPGKISSNNPPSDLCVKCNHTVEEDCVRLGTYQRWHSHCVQCMQCGKIAAANPVKDLQQPLGAPKSPDEKELGQVPKLSTARRPPANVNQFIYDPEFKKETVSFGDVPTVILCTDHGRPGCRGGFHAVSRLEQYAFLLNVALRRLYLLLKKQGVVPISPASTDNSVRRPPSETDPYRNSADLMKMKSVHLDRKLSATARLPKRSTIVESPSGKTAQPSDGLQSQRSQTQAQAHSRSPPMMHQQLSQGSTRELRPPNLGKLPMPLDSDQQETVIRPNFARANTGVMIVDDSAPNSPASGIDEPQFSALEDGITLADIPKIVQAAQAAEHSNTTQRSNATPYVAELSPLELAIVKHAAVSVLARSSLREHFDLEEILELVEVKKSGFWNKLFKQGDKKIKKKGVFGVPLELLVEREGTDSLLGATKATLRVPSFIHDVVSAMRQMDMSIEGIFRKNGNIRRLKELTDAIDIDPSSVDLTQDNPVQLAALLKKFLRELPDPLLTFKLHRLLIVSQTLPSDADRHRLLHMITLLVPKSHRDTMEVLFVFLKWVASFAHKSEGTGIKTDLSGSFAHKDEESGSKMDLGNLATVICPSILSSRGRDPLRDESFGAIHVVTSLLENQDEFFTVPAEFMALLRDQNQFANMLELPSKELMKKCDFYLRSRANGRPLAPPNGVYNGRPNTAGNNNNGDRTAMGGLGSPRPIHPGMPPSSNTYPAPASPAQSIPSNHGSFARGGPMESEYGSPNSRSIQSPLVSSRPPSFVQPRPNGGDPTFSSAHSNGHGTSPPMWQRT